MDAVYKLINVLKATVHAKSACRGVGVRSVTCNEDVLIEHAIGQLRLQFPSPNVYDSHIFLHCFVKFRIYGSLQQLFRGIDRKQINERLIVRYLQHKLALFQTMIDQYAGNAVVIHKMQHSLTVMRVNESSQFIGFEMNIDELIELLATLHLDAQLVTQRRVVSIGEDYVF